MVLAVSASAQAQGFGPDPFRPFNSQYDSYVYPIAPGPLDPVGNPSLNRSSVNSANQFEAYVNGLSGTDNGNRYDQLYRSRISAHRQAFRPGQEAEAKFEEQQTSITNLYFKYLRERDPRKRAVLLKQYNTARSQSNRELSSAGRSATGRTGRKKAEAGASTDKPRADAAEEGGEPEREPERVISPRRHSGGDSPKKKDAAPPAPPISGLSSPSGRDRTPSDVLDRATRAGAGGQGGTRSTGSDNAPPPPPVR